MSSIAIVVVAVTPVAIFINVLVKVLSALKSIRKKKLPLMNDPTKRQWNEEIVDWNHGVVFLLLSRSKSGRLVHPLTSII